MLHSKLQAYSTSSYIVESLTRRPMPMSLVTRPGISAGKMRVQVGSELEPVMRMRFHMSLDILFFQRNGAGEF